MYFRISKKWQFIFDILMIIVGTVVMGFAFSIFLEPNNISTGGFSGLSMIVNSLLSKVGITFLSTSVIYLILNVGLFLYALRTLGKKFAIKSIVGILSFSIAMEIFALIPFDIQYETLISAVYGGGIMGIGVGIVVRFGGSTGGSDMIASIIRNKTQKLSIGSIVVIVDMLVIFLSLFSFENGFVLLPYTIIALVIALFGTDFVNEGYKQVRAYHIITTKPEEISELIMTKLSRGCTATKVTGMHSKDDKYILTCLISKFQVNFLKKIIQDVDADAFAYSQSVNEVLGMWARKSELPEHEEDKPRKRKDKNVSAKIELSQNNITYKEDIKHTETHTKSKK